MKLPLEERHLRTKNQFLADIAVALGGFISEKLIFQDVSTGASSDIKEASNIARKLVTRYGMSALGPMTFGTGEEHAYLGREMRGERDYSEETAQRIDAEMREFIDHAYKAAEKVLTVNKDALKKIAETLMEKETLEQDDFDALLVPFKIKQVAV